MCIYIYIHVFLSLFCYAEEIRYLTFLKHACTQIPFKTTDVNSIFPSCDHHWSSLLCVYVYGGWEEVVQQLSIENPIPRYFMKSKE